MPVQLAAPEPEIDRPRDAVRTRYSAAAKTPEPALCCPVEYDTRLLEILPAEVIERDYGCGDPSRHVREGDRVLDLGSGGGKICFIASQLVGAAGEVIGVDVNDDMLELARRSAPIVAERLGQANVRFLRGQIQDLALDLDRLDEWLAAHPIRDSRGLAGLEAERSRLRRQQPMIPNASVDIVVSNCVLNLVEERDKGQLIREIFRVLAPGGRIALSDIVSDVPVPEALRRDPELWSGCISGAFHEKALQDELAAAGFYGISIDRWEHEPFARVDGIEFRSVTLTGHKGEPGVCRESNRSLIYRGPWRQVEDDDGHVLERGVRVSVCDQTFRRLTSDPYSDSIIGLATTEPSKDCC